LRDLSVRSRSSGEKNACSDDRRVRSPCDVTTRTSGKGSTFPGSAPSGQASRETSFPSALRSNRRRERLVDTHAEVGVSAPRPRGASPRSNDADFQAILPLRTSRAVTVSRPVTIARARPPSSITPRNSSRKSLPLWSLSALARHRTFPVVLSKHHSHSLSAGATRTASPCATTGAGPHAANRIGVAHHRSTRSTAMASVLDSHSTSPVLKSSAANTPRPVGV
jgi:hypothetical protein